MSGDKFCYNCGYQLTEEDSGKILYDLKVSKEAMIFIHDNYSLNEVTEEKYMTNDELLFKYAELFEKGLLTQEEFDKKKKELL